LVPGTAYDIYLVSRRAEQIHHKVLELPTAHGTALGPRFLLIAKEVERAYLLTDAPSAIISTVTFGTKVDVSMWERFRDRPLITIAAALTVVLVVIGFIVAAGTERLGQFALELGEFLRRVLEAVAWPVVLLVIAWMFRDEIKERIRHLRSLTVGGNKAEFVDSAN
jgi:hypothetical protein